MTSILFSNSHLQLGSGELERWGGEVTILDLSSSFLCWIFVYFIQTERITTEQFTRSISGVLISPEMFHYVYRIDYN